MSTYPTLIELESALLKHLATDRVLAEEWQTRIQPVPGLTKEHLETVFKRYPAVGTYIPGGKYQPNEQGILVAETASIYLLCAGKNLRGPGYARRGDDHSPGTLHLVERCRNLISAWQPGGNVKNIEVKGWQQAYANNQISVCALEVQVELTRPKVRTPEELERYGSTI